MLEFGQRRPELRTIFMGAPEFAIPCLEHLILNRHEVVAVYTQPDKPAGRGRYPVSTPEKKAAEAFNLPVIQPVNLRSADATAELAGFRPDVIVVAAFGQIMPQAVLDIPRHGCINVHFSLLPRFRGASPVSAAILAGDEFAGVSIMLMDRGLDTGPILTRAAIPVSARDTTGSLTFKLSQVAARLLQEVLSRWLRGQITPQAQDETAATLSGSISKEEGEIDWNLPAVDLWRQVRAFHPWPGSYTSWQGKQLKIIEAVPLPEAGTGKVGQVVALKKEAAAFGVCTGKGILGVLTVQIEGKRAMSAFEFLRGQRQFTGTVLPTD